MKRKPASKSAYFNPRVLISLAFCAIAVLLALGVALSASSLAPPTVSPSSSNTNAGQSPAVPVASSALVAASDNGPIQSEKQIPAPNALLDILYDQTDSPGADATGSQNFEPANDAFDDQAADDFVVPGGETWTVQQVIIQGAYFNGAGPAASVNVTFYADAATLPGASVPGGTYTFVPIAVDTAGHFTITLPTNLVLTTGTYWVSVQANMNSTAGGQLGWGWDTA